METYGGDVVCSFCLGFGEDKVWDVDRSEGDVIDAVSFLWSAFPDYLDNPTDEEKAKRPSQIIIEEDDVNDVTMMNTFVRDVVAVAMKGFSRGSRERQALEVLDGQISDFQNMVVEKAKRFERARGVRGARPGPILLSKLESESIYRILDLIEHIYGKYIRQLFLTKSKQDWPAWRKIFYMNAWHLGSFVRHGRPAKVPSPWVTGKRPPLEDDPFGNVPIGQEGT